jgi:hypothetical protein
MTADLTTDSKVFHPMGVLDLLIPRAGKQPSFPMISLRFGDEALGLTNSGGSSGGSIRPNARLSSFKRTSRAGALPATFRMLYREIFDHLVCPPHWMVGMTAAGK